MSRPRLTNIRYTVNMPATTATHFNGKEERFIYYSMNLTKNTIGASPITLTMCDNLGRVLYIEFSDYPASECNASVIEKSIKKLRYPNTVTEGHVWRCVISKKEVTNVLGKWLLIAICNNAKVCDIPHIQFVTDDPTYTFPILLDMIVGESETPKWLVPICISLYQDLPHISQPNIESEEDAVNAMDKLPCPIATVLRCGTETSTPVEVLFNACKLKLFEANQSEEDREIIKQYPLLSDVLMIRALYNSIWGYTYECD